MGYVGVKGGKDAIMNSELLVDFYRCRSKGIPIDVRQIRDQMRLAVDRVMSEGSLYSPDIAALALKQAEGDVLEASYLVRAFRSTLPRIGYTKACSSDDMFVIRRISSAFQDIPWGQVLGPTRDYTQRLLNFDLADESSFNENTAYPSAEFIEEHKAEKVIDCLRKEGLIDIPDDNNFNIEPYDITRQGIHIPLPRSGRLQRLTRGEEGAVISMGYASMRGWGSVHPTLAEVRTGNAPVIIRHPYWNEDVCIGAVLVTEADSICDFLKTEVKVNAEKKEKYAFSLGYGLVFGQNDRKAIAMSILDRSLSCNDDKASPVQDQEFVLLHIDGIESQGFISHLKLPHYVTFQSSLDRLRKIKKDKKTEHELERI